MTCVSANFLCAGILLPLRPIAAMYAERFAGDAEDESETGSGSATGLGYI